MRRPEDDWEELARREPHFAVLTNEEFLGDRLTPEAIRKFFATGEDDVAFLLDRVQRYAGHPVAPEVAIDFGCGVGRLTFALARHAKRVVGIDAAPTMLAIAGQRAAPNVAFTDQISEPGDLICSLIVFQHIPVDRGEALFRRLLQALRPGGVAAIHFALSRPGGAVKQMARKIRGSLPVVHRLAQILRRERKLPYMQINAYDRHRLRAIALQCGCSEPEFVRYDQREVEGAILITSRA